MDPWRQYLLRPHGESTLRRWAKRLSLFRFYRAQGGHAQDHDALEVAYRYHRREELEGFLAVLGVTLVTYAEKPPQPEPGVAYGGDELAGFPPLIRGTTWARQPGRSTIAGQEAFIWCAGGMVKISLGGEEGVCEADVLAAEAMEKVLAGAVLERVDPPADTRHYLCPRYYPEYFR